jgi:hypothetical protein
VNELFGILSIVITAFAYAYYIRGVLRKQFIPHPFSWFVWFILVAVGFYGQVVGNGGPGSWGTGFASVMCLLIFLLSWRRYPIQFSLMDWGSLFGAGMAIVLWVVTNNPVWSIILVTITDLIGFIPTYIKVYYEPTKDSPIFYFLVGLAFLVGCFGLIEYNTLTLLYPIGTIVANMGLIVLIWYRKK